MDNNYCDLCKDTSMEGTGENFKVEVLKDAIKNGFRPENRGIVGRMMAAKGVSRSEEIISEIMSSKITWGYFVCGECARNIKKYL